MLIRSLSEEPSSIQINEPQLAVVLGRITLKSRMPLTKGIGDRMGAKKKVRVPQKSERREEKSEKGKRKGGDKERLKLFELNARSAYSFGILLKSRLLFGPK